MRGDLADLALADRVFAPHYVEPVTYHCSAGFAPLRVQSDARALPVSEILAGESFQLLDCGAEWAWGQAADGCCGFVPLETLTAGAAKANGHAALAPDAAAIAAYAEAELGRPYAPGGRGGAGYDACGLVQRAAAAAGLAVPRFADLLVSTDSLIDIAAPARDAILIAGDLAAICLSEDEAVAALPGQGVVRIAIAELLAGGAEAVYRAAP